MLNICETGSEEKTDKDQIDEDESGIDCEDVKAGQSDTGTSLVSLDLTDKQKVPECSDTSEPESTVPDSADVPQKSFPVIKDRENLENSLTLDSGIVLETDSNKHENTNNSGSVSLESENVSNINAKSDKTDVESVFVKTSNEKIETENEANSEKAVNREGQEKIDSERSEEKVDERVEKLTVALSVKNAGNKVTEDTDGLEQKPESENESQNTQDDPGEKDGRFIVTSNDVNIENDVAEEADSLEQKPEEESTEPESNTMEVGRFTVTASCTNLVVNEGTILNYIV